jgi:hypothetical protein
VRLAASGGVEHHTGVVRSRVRCSSPDCTARDWTLYEEGDYPHRSFQPDVVADAVADVELGAQSMTAAATAHAASRDSVRRWTGWVSDLAKPRDLEQLVARIDPDAALIATRPTSSPAGAVLGLLERLVDVLARRGVPLPRGGSGLARLLAHRLARFGEVFFLTRFSPPLRADLEGLRM